MLTDIWIHTLWALIAGFIWSIVIVLIVFITSSIINIPGTFEQARLGWDTNALFPFILSFITFIASSLSHFLGIKILSLTNPEKYSTNIASYGQFAFFWILCYICMTPVYVYMWLQNYELIMMVFIIHVLTLSFGISLLLEICNSYQHVLVGIYGSFVGLFFAGVITIGIFSSFESWYAKLLSLLIMLPLIQSCLTLVKWCFEWWYYQYYLFTNTDGLWDILYRIEQEAKQQEKEEEMKNNL